jgi:hypothetical protein
MQELAVAATEDRTVVCGIVGSYYLKQMALQGILDVIGNTPTVQIELRIDVRPLH